MDKSDKRNAVFTIAVLSALLLIFTVADIFDGDRLFSETEKRVLAKRPELSWESLIDGSYASGMERYLTDQFVGRDKWISIKTATDIVLQKKEINGVYLGADGYLIEQHLPEDYTETQIQKKLLLLQRLVDRWDAAVMLVPTADNILADKLPPNTPDFDQKAFLDRVAAQTGEYYVDVYGALEEHADEEIYYRTDHHWTSLGAFYGYRQWAETKGIEEYPYDAGAMEIVSEDFQGTLQAKVNLDWGRDSIARFPETALYPVKVTYDLKTAADSLYEDSYLDTKDKYGYFMDGNHALVEIETGSGGENSLFVIRDSYANCLIPLLLPHYGKIYVLDLRYYNGRLFDLMEKCEAGGWDASDGGLHSEGKMEVLILYNCIHFLEEFAYVE